MIADDLGNAAANWIRTLEKPASRGVGELHRSAHIGDEHAIRHLIEDGGQAIVLGIESGKLEFKAGPSIL